MTLKMSHKIPGKVYLSIVLSGCVVSVAGIGSTVRTYEITLKEAEHRALDTSNQLKSLTSTQEAAKEQADAQFSSLLPRLTIGANYQYVTEVPTITLPIPGVTESFSFGSNNSWNVGPTLTYTVFDMGSNHDAYRGYDLLAQAREEDRKNGRLQLLLSVRSSYLRLQLALEELRLLNSSLELSRAQNHDIESNFKAGAATRLDRVDSQRDVLSYELQFSQKQAEVADDFRDLLAQIQETPQGDLSQAGPPNIQNVALELKLDTLAQSLQEAGAWSFVKPNDQHPQIRSQELQAQSAEKQAESQMDSLYPKVTFGASAILQYPNTIILQTVEQNTFQVGVSMPLFEGDHTRHLSAEKMKESESAGYTRDQTRINLDRDYDEAIQLLQSLRAQQKLSADDVEHSREAARLYYQSYKGGKVNLIDVQSANNRSLTAQVNAARIDAQVLNELFVLQTLSGEATSHGN
jgi:outer membrane protein TolC